MPPPESLPSIAVTMGDPAGIGPEICLKAAAARSVHAACRLLLVGDAATFEGAATAGYADMPALRIPLDDFMNRPAGELSEPVTVLDCPGAYSVPRAQASAEGGAASYRFLSAAIDLVLAGRAQALATAPISKAALHMAGVDYPGHTEILASRTGVSDYALMLYSERMAVAFVTCHVALARVPGLISRERIVRVIGLLRDALVGIRGCEPRLAVLGLNPHSGEGGLFGDEEQAHIVPAVEEARRGGLQVDGPLPPDAAFAPKALAAYDGHVAMYHDQGHIPFKMQCFHEGVNVTLGLPIIRTSVDHGTAFDIAWQGKANPSSLIHAILLAARMSGKGRVGKSAV